MKISDHPQAAEFLTAFFSVGVPYWFIPYNRATGAHALGGAAVVCAVTAAAMALRRELGAGKAMACAALAVPAAALVRVVYDTTMWDPTSHNLWPFELVVMLLLGYAGAVPGALLGLLLRRALPGGKAGE
jgi:hypothetical protein